MSMRANPFDEIERLFDRLSRQFEEASRTWDSGESFDFLPASAESMSVDLAEHDDAFVVTVDLPGYERDDVDVRVTDHTLTIDAETDESTEEGEPESYLRRERRHRSLHRSLRVPEAVAPEDVTARMKNGVLTVTLPKQETESAKTIKID